MDLIKMYEEARRAGAASENKMLESVAAMAPLLAKMMEEHPDEYWKMMRKQHEILWGPHYNEEFANHDVSKIHWTGSDGQQHHGAHWSKEQVVNATKGMSFPSGTTDCDKYVAFNAYYADMSKVVDDDTDIIKQAHAFYFSDEDAPSGKVWRYMSAMCC